MNASFFRIATTALLGLAFATTVSAQAGTATVRVETEPPAAEGVVRFVGAVSGELQLAADGTGSLQSALDAGTHRSQLQALAGALEGSGYELAGIQCDDGGSAERSFGDVPERAATFGLEAGESVTCTFVLALAGSCACPEEGRWRVVNHPGTMACTGVVTMTHPLKPSEGAGTLDINDNCTRILAEGMSDDEADIEMHLQDDCSWKGQVGGSQDGIPMVIHFRWNLDGERRITGDLESNVSQQGMTCRMSRTFELDFEG